MEKYYFLCNDEPNELLDDESYIKYDIDGINCKYVEQRGRFIRYTIRNLIDMFDAHTDDRIIWKKGNYKELCKFLKENHEINLQIDKLNEQLNKIYEGENNSKLELINTICNTIEKNVNYDNITNCISLIPLDGNIELYVEKYINCLFHNLSEPLNSIIRGQLFALAQSNKRDSINPLDFVLKEIIRYQLTTYNFDSIYENNSYTEEDIENLMHHLSICCSKLIPTSNYGNVIESILREHLNSQINLNGRKQIILNKLSHYNMIISQHDKHIDFSWCLNDSDILNYTKVSYSLVRDVSQYKSKNDFYKSLEQSCYNHKCYFIPKYYSLEPIQYKTEVTKMNMPELINVLFHQIKKIILIENIDLTKTWLLKEVNSSLGNNIIPLSTNAFVDDSALYNELENNLIEKNISSAANKNNGQIIWILNEFIQSLTFPNPEILKKLFVFIPNGYDLDANGKYATLTNGSQIYENSYINLLRGLSNHNIKIRIYLCPVIDRNDKSGSISNQRTEVKFCYVFPYFDVDVTSEIKSNIITKENAISNYSANYAYELFVDSEYEDASIVLSYLFTNWINIIYKNINPVNKSINGFEYVMKQIREIASNSISDHFDIRMPSFFLEKTFSVMAMDIIIDSLLNVKLLEINTQPVVQHTFPYHFFNSIYKLIFENKCDFRTLVTFNEQNFNNFLVSKYVDEQEYYDENIDIDQQLLMAYFGQNAGYNKNKKYKLKTKKEHQ
jgi:hypothetical protein